MSTQPVHTVLRGAEALLIDLDGTLCSTESAEVRHRAAGLPRPEILITSSIVTVGKPDPEGFLLAAHLLGVAPQQCAELDDSPTGIDAGRAAGGRVIALRTTHRDDQLLRADAIIDDLAALPI